MLVPPQQACARAEHRPYHATETITPDEVASTFFIAPVFRLREFHSRKILCDAG